jgi:GT2 family glycosyltransferase
MEFLPVSIIIPNYNGAHILAQSLVSVVKAAQAYQGKSEIIVVDDASLDNSIQLISKKFPTIKVIRHSTNKGFAEAVHSGTRASIYSILILLNSDVLPGPNFIAPLIRWFKLEDTFAVSPLILDHSGKPLRVSWNMGKIVRGEIRRRKWDIDDARRVKRQNGALKSLYSSGGSTAIRKDMFIQLRGFLPLYRPFYSEDRDLGTRAWQRGWQTLFEPESRVVHDHEGTIKRFFPAKRIKIIRRRNRFFYLWLHLSTNKLFFSHFPWTFFYRLPLRLLKMDLVYAISLFKALFSLGDVIKLRGILKQEYPRGSLEKIIEEVGS